MSTLAQVLKLTSVLNIYNNLLIKDLAALLLIQLHATMAFNAINNVSKSSSLRRVFCMNSYNMSMADVLLSRTHNVHNVREESLYESVATEPVDFSALNQNKVQP